MRILSQDGLHEGIIDVPYEQVSIEQKGSEIWCGYSSTMDRYCVGKCFANIPPKPKQERLWRCCKINILELLMATKMKTGFYIEQGKV